MDGGVTGSSGASTGDGVEAGDIEHSSSWSHDSGWDDAGDVVGEARSVYVLAGMSDGGDSVGGGSNGYGSGTGADWMEGTDHDGSGGANTRLISGGGTDGCLDDDVDSAGSDDLGIEGGQSERFISGCTVDMATLKRTVILVRQREGRFQL